MSWERQNGNIVRTGFVISPQSSSTIALGDAGLWLDSAVSKTKLRVADGSDRGILRAEGVIPSARCAFSVNPTAADTLTIGTKTFTFKSSLIAATTTTQVKILGSAALTLAALLDAINGVTNINVVTDTTPFTTSVVADAVSATVLRIRGALTQGGTAAASAFGSTTLAASISGGASAWSVANVSALGKAATDCKFTAYQFAVTAAMVTAGSVQVELPFTPTCFSLFVTASTGVQRASTAAATISGNALNVVLAGGGSPDIQSGDLLRFWAME